MPAREARVCSLATAVSAHNVPPPPSLHKGSRLRALLLGLAHLPATGMRLHSRRRLAVVIENSACAMPAIILLHSHGCLVLFACGSPSKHVREEG
mmetsp:Transcript_16361/g.47695  ORF Transcript_16361/g.47695 Transcript_16361/m.47695 type:complete len:95 (+) Transcript_16361:654-938(+)